jgi:hypothetical protein
MSQQYDSLYLERYASGHKRGCPRAIPEIRRAMFQPPCECAEIDRELAEREEAVERDRNPQAYIGPMDTVTILESVQAAQAILRQRYCQVPHIVSEKLCRASIWLEQEVTARVTDILAEHSALNRCSNRKRGAFMASWCKIAFRYSRFR